MRISWGVGITITIIVFTLISFAFIYFAFNQEVNLVRDDYYEEEVRHQEKIDKIKRTQNLTKQLIVKLEAENIVLNFPTLFDQKKITGTILLFRPADRNKDKLFPVEADSNLTQYIETNDIIPGLWKVQVNWEVDSNSFFNEKILMVQ